jgi:hypothetical protein
VQSAERVQQAGELVCSVVRDADDEDCVAVTWSHRREAPNAGDGRAELKVGLASATGRAEARGDDGGGIHPPCGAGRAVLVPVPGCGQSLLVVR